MAKRRYKSKKVNSRDLKTQVYKLFLRLPKKRLNAKQIGAKLKISNSKDAIQYAVDQLAASNKIVFVKDDKYKLNKLTAKLAFEALPSSTYKGRVDMTKQGSGFLIVENLEQDLFIPRNHLKGAMDGDIVEVTAVFPKGKKRGEAKVRKILKRKLSSVVGRLYFQKRYALVDVMHTRNPLSVCIKPGDTMFAKDEDIVVVEIISWGNGQNNTIWGKVKQVIDEENLNEINMQSILSMNGFDSFFPQEVKDEMKFVPDEVPESDKDGRRDLRDTVTFTIDPETAKDFDDALSIKYLPEGIIEVGIHIADVSHYVKPNTNLDKEAYHRSTSVYLVDRTIPMLPEKLSNSLCSLNPQVDRLSFSAMFLFDEKYKIIDRWFGKSVIYSDKRFTYEAAQEILESGEGEFAKELSDLNAIAKKLRKKKFKNGAINFDSDEIKFKLDKNSKPIELIVKRRKEAHLLVEDFMLLANKEVARFIGSKEEQEIPFVYRVHDLPDTDRLVDISLFAKELGFNFKYQTPQEVKESINALAKAAKKDEALKLLEPLAIRAMSKAIYTTNNIGHYGLGFQYYGHFTSPIRRYADVLVHRILEANIEKTVRMVKGDLEIKCKHISSQEKKATEAERDSVKYKKVEFMANRIGEEFEAIISGMIERGIFVEVKETKAEGLIQFSRMTNDYSQTENKYIVLDRTTGQKLKFGDTVNVRLLEVNLEDKLLEFELVES